MEDLSAEQSDIGSKLELLLKNFKKDSPSRKTEEYLDKRSTLLESYWTAFSNNHQKLIPFEESNSDHPYFQNQYFEEVKKLVTTTRSLIFEAKTKLIPTTTNTTTHQTIISSATPASTSITAISSNPLMSAIHKTDKSAGFKLSYEHEHEAPEDELERMVRKQKALMKTVTHIIQDIEAKAGQDHPKPYYELKINLLCKYEAEMSQNDNQIWENSAEEKPYGYEFALYHELDDWAQDTIITLQQQLLSLNNSVNTNAPVHISNNSQFKLPKIELPHFDGNYLKWTQFHDLFSQLIHSQPISNAQKMFYLTSNLTGEAKTLIQHLPVSNENYEDAWNILQNRYNNKRLLVTALLNKFLSQPTSHVESAATIKALHDTTNECLLGLKNLGISITSWDPLLVHILIKKFDKTTHTLYEQSLEAPRELNSIKKTLEFLEMRFQALEALGGKAQGSSRDKYKQRQGYQSKPSAFVATSHGFHCIACKLSHPLYSCKKFLALPPNDRLQLVIKGNLCINCLRDGHTAAKCTLRGCTKCSKRHNTLVHLEHWKCQSKDAQPPLVNPKIPANHVQRSYVLLSTVSMIVINSQGEEVECRAVLDSGSQLHFISERLVKNLNLKEVPESIQIQGIGQDKQRTNRRINVEIRSRTTGFTTRIEAFVLKQITANQPARMLDTSSWPIPKNIELADPQFHKPGRIDLLIGAEIYFDLLSIGQIKLKDDMPTLQNTVFGWIIAGKVREKAPLQVSCGICSEDEEKLDEQMEKFWKLEDVETTTTNMTATEYKCEEHFNRTMRRNEEGRYVVKLPFMQEPNNLGDSKNVALRRFLSLERKLDKNPEIRMQYSDFMKEYIQLGHMKEIRFEDVLYPHYFIPHHSVLKPDSTTTKLRVVFDASMKTSSNISLNQLLHTGPAIQEDLVSILLRFRTPRFVFTADIEKMYRQILIDKDDRRFQQILWRDNPKEPVKCYQLLTVTYGIRTAPYLAIRCLHHLAAQYTDQYPLGAKVLQRDFYVDDLMTGSNSLREARDIQEQINEILSSAGFKLRKWCANHTSLLQNVACEDRALQLDLKENDDHHVKTLGLTWLPKTDDFLVKTFWSEEQKVTKRKVLSVIAHLFDPLGIMSPVIVSAKLFLQKLWTLKVEWDSVLPMALHTEWTKFREELQVLNNVKIARHIFGGKVPQTFQVHAFSDASEKAFDAAIYVRSILQDGTVIVRLLCAKSRVAPIKTVTVPRLELCAAKLAALLLQRVKDDLGWNQITCYLWTDSEIVLAWLNSQSSSFHTFVANRVAAIQEITSANQWRHVSSGANPADLISRGVSPKKLNSCNQWFYGPLFLHGPEESWPKKKDKWETDLERRNHQVALPVITQSTCLIDSIDHRNSFKHLQRVIAYVLRFIKNTRCRNKADRRQSHLTIPELDDALTVIIKDTQSQGFQDDLQQLRRTQCVHNGSGLSSLSPFLDNHGIIRVGGRLAEANITYDAKHPILLPYSHDITKLLMTHLHTTNLHAGPQTLLSITRQKYWPIKGKTTARSIVQNCVRCSRVRPKLMSQFMGNLPATRVQPARPFINAGVDFAGPFWIHFKIRGKRPQKCYIAVFCCFATKTIHIEVVSDLTTAAFIGALKRFVSRRGNCRNLYCDNATNFIGARNQLTELKDIIYSKHSEEKIHAFCDTRGIGFHFIPPRAPHFGGLWEAAVKSAKHLLLKSVATASLTYEELETIMTEIEAILNSRPLTQMSSDPRDLAALTPGHFLIGEPITSTIDPQAEEVKVPLLQRWKLVTHLKYEFWRRWSTEYLNELQHRYKWKKQYPNAKRGTLVVIKDDNLPVLKWSLGRIINTIKGDDGLVRVADVRTASGVMRRPIHKLAPLPVEQEDEPSTSGMTQSNQEDPPGKDSFNNKKPRDPSNSRDEQPPSSTQNSSSSKRRRFTGSSINLALLTCLIMPILSQEVTINPFQTQPGIYFESMGSTHLVSNEWNLIIYYNMTTYWREFKGITDGIQKLEEICCKLTRQQSCNRLISQLNSVILELKDDNDLLLYQPHSRQKRAPLNIIGNIASSLFGVLDSSYAEQMSKIITNLEGNDQHLLDLLKNQTSVIDSTVNIMKKSYEEMEVQFKELEQYINQTTTAIKKELLEQRLAETVNSLSVHLILLITNYQRTQNNLLDVVMDTRHGKINPQLLAPRQLQDQLILIKENLPPTVRLPATHNNLLELYSCMTVEGRVVPGQIIFRVKLPLLSYETFEMLRIVPVPVPVNETFLTIEPSTKYLIASLHRDQYYPLSELQLSMCTTIGTSTHMCQQHHPLYRRESNISACEMSFLTHSTSSYGCKVPRSDNVPRWIQLLNPNHWIYVMKNPTTINIACGNTVIQKILKGQGILNITAGCAIKEPEATIQAHNLYTSAITSFFVSSKNLTDVLQPKEIDELLYQPPSRKSLDEEFQNLKNRIKQMKTEEAVSMKTSIQEVHQFSVGYIALLIAMAILGYIIYTILSR